MGNMILFLAIAVVLGVGLGILFNKLVIKNFPETSRKMKYVVTVIVFLLITVVLVAALCSKKFIIDPAVIAKCSELEQYIVKNHSNLDFVRNGLNITAISKDISRINKTVVDLSVILWPKAKELGVPRFVYDVVLSNISGELQKRLVIVDSPENKTNPFIDEKNFLTVSSLINGIQTTILKVVKTVVFVIVVICLILLGIYILVALSTASKEKKRIGSKDAG
jgi:branched-subunit amino acid ABC-type transport system permease component